MRSTIVRKLTALVALAALAALLAACGKSSPSPVDSAGPRAGGHAAFEVVAAENFWGSIAGQLAGDRAAVQSIVVNPATDPHSYETTAQDARTIAGAGMAIVNGIGYDNWMTDDLGASPSSGRVVLDVGDLLGLKQGDNAHQWYSPSSVHRVIEAIVADYDKLDPADAAYFAQRKRTLETQGLARYNQLRQAIRARYKGVAVGYSESIFRPLGEDLGLKLLTPYSFAEAIAEGTDVTAQDKQTVDRQARDGQIEVWVYNSQNVTPDVQRITSIVKARHIPVATVTETLSPASDSFQQWQAAELQGLAAALHRATGR
jgi:zinc/manganese transport system substrate-binding protein